jgi:SAM-dependent methyltransferase
MVKLDGQHNSHGGTYAYSKPSFPEFYDLWVESLLGAGPIEDAPIIAGALQNILSQDRPDREICIVDVGTGTGRVVRDLVTHLHVKVAEAGSPKVKIIAFDHSAAMIARAQKLQLQAFPTAVERANLKVQFHRASASSFLSAVPSLCQNADLVVFAAGGIGHLTLPGEAKAFLWQVHAALRHDIGAVAIISMLEDMRVGAADMEEVGDGPHAEVEDGVDACLPSVDNLGLLYLKSPTVKTRLGQVMTEEFSVKAVRGGEVEWEDEMAWSMKAFDENEWKDLVREAGLRIRDVKEGVIQRWYFLEHANAKL